MKPVPVVLVALALAAAVTAAFVGMKHEPDPQIDPSLPDRVAARPSAEHESIHISEAAHAPVHASSPVRASADDRQDYGAMIDKLLPLAEDGDAEAQYEIYKATAYCRDRVKFFFTRAGQRLTLEQGLAWTLKGKGSYEIAQAVHKKCRSFIERDARESSSDAVHWLNASAQQGYAPAQSALATNILEEDLFQSFENAADFAASRSSVPLDRTKSAAELFSEAVKSRDPEVLFTVGDMLSLMRPESADDDLERFAWMTLACERGFDCSAQAEWVVAGCLSAECQSINSPTEVVRILTGDRWHEVQARARELGADLDAGRWPRLGLDPGSATSDQERTSGEP